MANIQHSFNVFCIILYSILHIAVDPVVQGKTRAEQFYSDDKEVSMCLIYNIIHLKLIHTLQGVYKVYNYIQDSSVMMDIQFTHFRVP